MTEAVGFRPRRVDLGDGRAVVIRPGRPDDVGRLAELYDGLSEDDVYLRFFTAHRPGRELFERMVTAPERGGVLLVAETADDGERSRIVGDTWYSLLPNGNGELAITVAPDWRGWLGAYLLDALLDAAAQQGVPNLEAEVLLRNRAMMALVRRRGCVRVGDEGSSVRVAVATRGRIPTWPPGGGHPRVLVEGRRGWRAHDEAAHRGIEVAVCPGPPADSSRCPVLAGGVCPLVEEADAVVLSLAPGDERTRELLRAHRSAHPGIPMFLDDRSSGVDGEDVTVLPHAATDEELVDLILRDLARADVVRGGRAEST